MEARIRSHFEASIETKQRTLATMLPAILGAAQHMAAVLKAGNKVLACGNGGSAADAQHFAAELTGRYERERPGLAGIALTTDTSALTAIANDYSYEQVFSKQVQALVRPGDLLLGISTSGNSANVIRAIEAAHQGGASVIALTGKDGGRMAAMLKAGDFELRSASNVTARVQETHLVFLHCLCDLTDEILFPA
ncbi:phosphoheptose isomerase [Nevskia soli]|uniref:phosphoheptose isomerase n=1 Tax=Nevskia soli TaxID=418856 RepID=UPI0034507A3F